MNEIKKQLGKKIKYYRELRGMTQEVLAEKLDMNCRSLSFLECGTNFVTAESLDRICRALGVTPKQLFSFEYYPVNPENVREDILNLIDTNSEKINDVYNILRGFLG